MARSSFLSFHYDRDFWRVQQIRNMGALDEQEILPAQKWEEVKKKGRAAVEAWIDKEMRYKQAVIVLVGNQTAVRPFVQYEVRRAWEIRKPLLGIRIHGLKDSDGNTDSPGLDPFAQFGVSESSGTMADYVTLHDPGAGVWSPTSNDIYRAISENIATWASKGYKRP